MSAIIKDMDVPKSCYDKNTDKQCKLCDAVLNCLFVGDVEGFFNKRHPDCPLREIGGRLIDENVLHTKLDEFMYGIDGIHEYIHTEVPSVLDAEEQK